MNPSWRLRLDATAVGLGALVLEGLAGVTDWWWTGSVGMGAPLMGMVLGIGIGLSLHARRRKAWLTRASLRRLSLGVAGIHFLAGGALWGASSKLSGGALLMGMGAIGLLVGLSALIVTMCAGDAVAMVFSPFSDAHEGEGEGGPSGPWRRR